MKNTAGMAASPAPGRAGGTDNIYRYESACARCGQVTRTSFEPDGIRPVYCRECLVAVKEEKIQEMESRRLEKDRELSRLPKRFPAPHRPFAAALGKFKPAPPAPPGAPAPASPPADERPAVVLRPRPVPPPPIQSGAGEAVLEEDKEFPV